MGKQIIENILQTPNQTKAININFNVFITHQQHIKKKKTTFVKHHINMQKVYVQQAQRRGKTLEILTKSKSCHRKQRLVI